MSILLTGGTGTLGKLILPSADKPSHAELDVTQAVLSVSRKDYEEKDGRPGGFKLFPNDYSLIVHAAAYTNVLEAETSKMMCFDVNVIGTLNMLLAYPETPFVYISSEYARRPVNFYSATKKMAEEMVKLHPHHLIIRTLFKPSPWKYDYAFEDAYTMGDTVEIIAPLIEKEIMSWDKKTSKTIYVGTGRKTILDIARKTKPDVIPNKTSDIKGVIIPKDYI